MNFENFENEEWRTVQFLPPDVEVSSLGRVRRYITLIQREIVKGTVREYHYVSINGKSYPVHRLVASAFIPNPNNGDIVNHKNGNKLDNRVENLEWVSLATNLTKSSSRGIDSRKKIYCKELDKVFGSMRSAAYLTKIPQDIIAEAIKRNETVCSLSFQIVEHSDPLVQSHNIFYIDFETMYEIAHKSSSEQDMDDLIRAEIGQGISNVT